MAEQMIPKKMTFRPGDLAGPMENRIKETQETPSKYVRRLIAADLGVKAPEMRGNVANLKQYAKPNKLETFDADQPLKDY